MSEWSTRGAMQWIALVGVGVVMALAVAAEVRSAHLAELATYGALALLLVRFFELRRRRIFVDYQLSAEETARFQGLDNALRELAAGGALHGVQGVARHYDWKRNAGTSGTVQSQTVALRRARIPHVVTNVRPWSARYPTQRLVFIPDGLLLWRNHGEFTVCSYRHLEVTVSTEDLVWSGALPAGAMIVGQRWRYIRVDGGPDRRFANNYQIPVVRTGCLRLRGPDGLEEILQTTSLSAAMRVERELRLANEVAFVEEQSLSRDAAIDQLQGSDAAAAALDFSSTKVIPGWRSAERWVSAAAVLMALLVFAAARGSAMEKGIEATSGSLAVAERRPDIPPAMTAPLPVGRVTIDCPLRVKPSSSARKLTTLPQDTEVVLVDARSGWRKVRAQSGDEGWTGPKCWQAVVTPTPRRINAPRRQAPERRMVAEAAAGAAGSPAQAIEGEGDVEAAAEEEPAAKESAPAPEKAPAKVSPLDQLTEEEKVRLEALDLE